MKRITEVLLKEKDRRTGLNHPTFDDYIWLTKHKWVKPVIKKKTKRRKSTYY